MLTLIKNIAKLYSPDVMGSYGSVIELANPSLLLENTKIKKIFHGAFIPSSVRPDIEIDARDACILPGFVDAHTHPVFWQTRENEFLMRLQGKSYQEIAAAGGGIRNSARNFRSAGKDEIKKVTKARLLKFLEHGTTTIEAKSGYGLSTEDEIKSLEIIAELNREQSLEMVPTFLGAHEVPDAYQKRRTAYIQLIIDEMLPQIAERKLAKYCDVFCEKDVFSIEETRLILEAAAKNGLKGRIHADELSAFGGAELAADVKALTADHLVNVSDEGIWSLSKAGVIAILLPITTFFLRKDHYAPAVKMLEYGCQIALATDFNPGSAMTQNMQLVWSVAALKMGLVPGELLWATTIIPARSLELDHMIGSIEENKQADFVLLDIPNLEYLPYHIGINHVLMTIKKGKVAYRK
jgi:imidazolonepropionase